MSEESDEPRVRRVRWVRMIVIALVMLLYPLSVGPAYVLEYRHVVSAQTNSTIYRPIHFAVEKGGTQVVYNRYVTWWFDITGTLKN